MFRGVSKLKSVDNKGTDIVAALACLIFFLAYNNSLGHDPGHRRSRSIPAYRVEVILNRVTLVHQELEKFDNRQLVQKLPCTHTHECNTKGRLKKNLSQQTLTIGQC